MSMIPLLVKPLIKTEIDKQINRCIAMLAGELDHRSLMLKLNVDITDLVLTLATSSPFGLSEENVRTEHHNGYSWTETTGDGKKESFLNAPGHVSLEDFLCSGTLRLNDLHLEQQVLGMRIRLTGLSFRFQLTGTLAY